MPEGGKQRNLGQFAAAITRLFQAPRTTIRGIDPTGWFTPMQPIKPAAPAGTEPRAFQYTPGINLITSPRSDKNYTANDLREFAKYDLAAILINNVMDSICRMPWAIKPRMLPGEKLSDLKARTVKDSNIPKITRFFERPNPEQNWSRFLRPVLHDLLVIDAASILILSGPGKKGKPGDVVELRPIDGATINRYFDVQGFTPKPPDPAYAQLWYGQPMVNLTTDQLIYRPRNILPGDTYGTSPCEQAVKMISVGIDRLSFQAAYYTQGSVPDVVQVVPKGISPDTVEDTMEWMNSQLAGNLAKRRNWRYIQGFTDDGKDQVLFPKEALLVDPFDDYVIRCLCYAFGTSPQRLVKMIRTEGQAADDATKDEGLAPWLDWVSGTLNDIIQIRMGFTDYEFAFAPEPETDVLKQAQADDSDVKAGIRKRNEVRADRGLPPASEKAADELNVITATGVVSIDAVPPAPPTGGGFGDSGGQPGKPGQGAKPDGGGPGKPNGTGKPAAGKPNGKPAGGASPATPAKAHCAVHEEHDQNCKHCLKIDLDWMLAGNFPIQKKKSSTSHSAPITAIPKLKVRPVT